MEWAVMEHVLTGEHIEIPDVFKGVSEGLDNLKDKTKKYTHEFKGFGQSMVDFAEKIGKAVANLFPTGGGGTPTTPMVTDPRDEQKEGVLPEPFKPKGQKEVIEHFVDMKQVIQSAIGSLQDFGAAMADVFTGKANGVETFFLSIIEVVADFIGALGRALVAAGVGSKAFKKLLVNPGAAIAAGAALIVTAGIVRRLLQEGPAGSGGGGEPARGGGRTQGLAVGGIVTSGGVFQLHKDEMVALPRGAAVTPAHMVNGQGGSDVHVEIEGNIRAYYLELLSKHERHRRRQMG